MTVTSRRPGRARPTADLVTPDHRRLRGQRAQGHADHPGRRAARHPDPAVLRPPAARPGRRLPPVHRRGRGPAQAADASCTTTVTEGMVVKTQLTSPVAEKAQQGTLELLLINHPLDCPVCDKGGECPLQNQAMSHGDAESRFHDVKRTYPKPIAISSQVLLDRERCVLCARCTRFQPADRRRPVHRDVRARRAAAGRDLHRPAVRVLLLRQHRADLPGRRAHRRGLPLPRPPVRPGLDARWSASTARPAARCAPTTAAARCCAAWPARTRRSTRSGTATRAAGRSPTPRSPTASPPRSSATTRPAGCAQASWTEALDARRPRPRARPRRGRRRRAARRPADRRGRLRLGQVRPRRARHQRRRRRVRPAQRRGARLPRQLGRRPLPRDDLRRPRARARRAARRLRAGGGVADRLPAAAQGGPPHGTRVFAVAPFRQRRRRSRPRRGCCAPLPGAEAAALDALRRQRPADPVAAEAARRCAARRGDPGRRAAAPAAPARCPPRPRWPRATGARLAWVPRRAGERGAVDAGALPTLLPGGRPSPTPAPAPRSSALWGAAVPAHARPRPHRHPHRRPRRRAVGAARRRRRPGRLPRPGAGARRARRRRVRRQPRAAPLGGHRPRRRRAPGRRGRREGRHLPRLGGPGPPVRAGAAHHGALPDLRVLHLLADELDVPLGLPDVAAARAEIGRLGATTDRPAAPAADRDAGRRARGRRGRARTWHWLLDDGALQDGEPHLAGTAKEPRLHLSRRDGRRARRRRRRARHRLHRPRLPDPAAGRSPTCPTASSGCPTRTPDAAVRRDLAAAAGSVVRLGTREPRSEPRRRCSPHAPVQDTQLPLTASATSRSGSPSSRCCSSSSCSSC